MTEPSVEEVAWLLESPAQLPPDHDLPTRQIWQPAILHTGMVKIA